MCICIASSLTAKAALMLSYIVGNMKALHDATYYYGSMIAVVRILMAILKLSNYWQVATQYYHIMKASSCQQRIQLLQF